MYAFSRRQWWLTYFWSSSNLLWKMSTAHQQSWWWMINKNSTLFRWNVRKCLHTQSILQSWLPQLKIGDDSNFLSQPKYYLQRKCEVLYLYSLYNKRYIRNTFNNFHTVSVSKPPHFIIISRVYKFMLSQRGKIKSSNMVQSRVWNVGECTFNPNNSCNHYLPCPIC